MTIAQQLKVNTFPFIVKVKDGKEIYFENYDGTWCKREYDARGNEIYYENSDGDWTKRELDTQGKELRYENSDGFIKDYRPKDVELTLQQIADKMGIKVEQLRIKN